MVKVQRIKIGFMISIPKSKAKLIGPKGGEEFDVEFGRISRTLAFIPLGQ